MDREELLGQLRAEIQQRFMDLSEDQKNVIRENRDTEYAQLLREVLGQELLSGLRAGPPSQNQPLGLMGIN